ncbi:unnamed protein product [Symbiodinium necroappetens]|uniref:SH3 domain-containing protein n=1 Tax=Symbiodinium necroappetens TaxID=1628268 RepID=A0A813B6L1_9DINO|nr:unnamed protein product [Symbiodinium necroappetens]
MTDAALQTVVKEIQFAAGCTEYKAKVKLMEANLSQRDALMLISDEQRMMEQEANERYEEMMKGLREMHQQQLNVDNFLEDLEYVCCESFLSHEEEICLRVLKGERLKLYYQDPLESDYLEHAGGGWAYVGFKDNKHTHGWIPQECMQVAVRSPKKRVQWQRYRVRESWFAQKHHDIDGYLRVNTGDTIEMLETVEAGACSWVYCYEIESGVAGEIPESRAQRLKQLRQLKLQDKAWGLGPGSLFRSSPSAAKALPGVILQRATQASATPTSKQRISNLASDLDLLFAAQNPNRAICDFGTCPQAIGKLFGGCESKSLAFCEICD